MQAVCVLLSLSSTYLISESVKFPYELDPEFSCGVVLPLIHVHHSENQGDDNAVVVILLTTSLQV
jgi:hypothetical protein